MISKYVLSVYSLRAFPLDCVHLEFYSSLNVFDTTGVTICSPSRLARTQDWPTCLALCDFTCFRFVPIS
jgi:hypothetical protein